MMQGPQTLYSTRLTLAKKPTKRGNMKGKTTEIEVFSSEVGEARKLVTFMSYVFVYVALREVFVWDKSFNEICAKRVAVCEQVRDVGGREGMKKLRRDAQERRRAEKDRGLGWYEETARSKRRYRRKPEGLGDFRTRGITQGWVRAREEWEMILRVVRTLELKEY